MNGKLTIEFNRSENFRKACELADIKIIDFLKLDTDIKFIVRFRDPVKLFEAGIYFARLESGSLKLPDEIPEKKLSKNKTKKS